MIITNEDVERLMGLEGVEVNPLVDGWKFLWTGWKEDVDPECLYSNIPRRLRSDILVSQWVAFPWDGKKVKGDIACYASSPGTHGRIHKGECFNIDPSDGQVVIRASSTEGDKIQAKRETLMRLLELIERGSDVSETN